MSLREMILAEHSKKQTNKIIEYVGRSQEKLDELVKLFLGDEYRVIQRVGWPLSFIGVEQPLLIKKHLKKMLQNLDRPNLHDAVKRNTMRLFQEIEIPKALEGRLMDLCFKFLEEPAQTVAVKAFSLTILHRLSKQYPEIVPEIRTLVEAQLPHQTAAFKVRARPFVQG